MTSDNTFTINDTNGLRNSGVWNGYWFTQPPNRSSQCPHCSPRCPHGFPADFAPAYPTWTITCNGSGNSNG
jgi:hypothetical protein